MVKGDKLLLMASTLEDSGELWSLESGLFDVVFDVSTKEIFDGSCYGNRQAPELLSGSRIELCSQGTTWRLRQTTVDALAAATLLSTPW